MTLMAADAGGRVLIEGLPARQENMEVIVEAATLGDLLVTLQAVGILDRACVGRWLFGMARHPG